MRKIWKQRLYRRQVQMMTACAYYAGGFIWGSKNNKDYTPELLRVKEMILNYMKVNAWKKEIRSICEQVLWILFYDAIS